MKRWILIVLLALFCALLQMQISSSSWGAKIEPLALDLWFQQRGPIKPPDDIIIVSMDESSYRVLEVPLSSAWPRELHAQLLAKLKQLGVKRVVMDILFLDAGPSKQADEQLSQALKLSPTVIGVDAAVREEVSAVGRYTLEDVYEPLESFAENAEGLGLARLPDDFGYIRRFLNARTKATQNIPILYEAALGPEFSGAKPNERDLIWFYGPSGTIPTYQYHQVLNPKGQLPRELFAGKTVFVGLDLRTELGPAEKDAYQTSFYQQGPMYGVEIHAVAAANLLQQHWIRRASAGSEQLALFIVTFLATALIFALRPLMSGLFFVSFALLWAFGSYSAFTHGFFVPGVVLVGLVLPLSYLGSTLAYYILTYRTQQRVERAFQFYLSPEMTRQLRNDPKLLELGGEDVFGTVLFTDIANFTAITEGMLAADVSKMLNAYFTEVMKVIFDNKGTLIKFIGDAVFVIWGAPLKISDHARRACQSALAIQAGVERFNASKRFPELHTRIGVNTGSMVVGNLGSEVRFDYTAIGDVVNFCSRLESLNKRFGTSIIVSEFVRREAGEQFNYVPLGAIRVSGKREAVPVFTLFEKALSPQISETWNRALNLFRLRRWSEAQQLFSQAGQLEPALATGAQLYCAEIEAHRVNDPGEEWRGEIVFTSK